MQKVIQFGNRIHLFLVFTVLVAAGTAQATDGYWTNDGSGNWSDSGNWLNGVIANSGAAYFTNPITASRIVTVDSAPSAIGNMTFTNTGAYGWTINGGTLNLSGSTITVSAGSTATVVSAISSTAGLTKAGTGILNLNGTVTLGNLSVGVSVAAGSVVMGNGSSISVGSGSGNNFYVGVSSGGNGTLDASLSSIFTANVNNFYVGTGSSGGIGTLKLGASNVITAVTLFGVGSSDWDWTTGTLTTANNSTTTIHTPLLRIGYGVANGTSSGTGNFTLGTNAILDIDGLSGGRTDLIVGYDDDQYGRSSPGSIDLSAGIAILKLSSLVVGHQLGNANSPGTLLLSTNALNHLDISGTNTVVVIGYLDLWGGNNGGSTTGTLTIGGLDTNSTITATDNSTAVRLGYRGASASGSGIGIFNLSGGTLTITTTGSAITSGGGTGTSRLNLRDCTLASGACSTNWIWGLTTATLTNNVIFNSGTNSIVIPQVFSGTGNLIKTGSGSMVLSGTNTYTGATTVSNGNLLVNGTITSTVSVASSGGFGGSGYVNGNVSMFSGARGVFVLDDPIDITGTLVLNGNNTAHLIMPAGATNGLYRVGYYNSSGSSGKFESSAVIDSGSAPNGTPAIIMGNGTIDVQISPPGFLLTIR